MCFQINDAKGIIILSVLVVYRSPSSNKENDSNLYKINKEVILLKRNFFIVSNFNFPDINWIDKTTDRRKNSSEKKFLNILNDNFLTQIFRLRLYLNLFWIILMLN